jgi:hypothetical protein
MTIAVPFNTAELDLLRARIKKAVAIQTEHDVKTELGHPYYRRFMATVDDLLAKMPKEEPKPAVPDEKDDV